MCLSRLGAGSWLNGDCMSRDLTSGRWVRIWGSSDFSGVKGFGVGSVVSFQVS
jgi:hypothetical protein